MNRPAIDRPFAPVVFPPGETVFEAASLGPSTLQDIDRVLFSGRCKEGRLELETRESRLTALIHKSTPYLAGLQEGDVFSPVRLSDFVVRAGQLETPRCRLISCDNSLVLMTAVHFVKRPDLRGSLKLINPAHVLRTLAKEERDAALALERNGVRTLLFLHKGQPARVFFGNPSEDPKEGSIEDRLLSWAFKEIATTKVEVFTDLTVAPDPDAGTSFVRLDDEAQPPPPATFSVFMERREIRGRPFSPPEMIIGRDPRVDLFIDNLGVSRHHAKVWWERGRFVLRDLGSSNGTMVNGERIDETPIQESDVIKIGKFQIVFSEREQEIQVAETMLVPTQGASDALWLVGGTTRYRNRSRPFDGQRQGRRRGGRGMAAQLSPRTAIAPRQSGAAHLF